MKEVEITLSFNHLEKEISNELNDVQSDIDTYIEASMNQFNKESKYRLNKKDGFLDWVFGWGTGYKLIWKKLKGLAGSNDNEIEAVQNEFMNEVIQYKKVLKKIHEYSQNRIVDFYKSTSKIVIKDIDNKIKTIEKINDITYFSDISKNDLPWGKYIVQTGKDSFELTQFVTTDLTIATVIGAKVATILGPKVLGIISAKAAAIVAGKVASVVGLIFAPIIDYAFNETAKFLQYDNTKIQFESAIDEITKDMTAKLKDEYNKRLLKIKKNIALELHKTLIIKGRQ